MEDKIVGSRNFYIEKIGTRGSHKSNCGSPVWESQERQSPEIIEQKDQG
jgi:hypothetical protein